MNGGIDMLPQHTYIVRFIKQDGKTEECEHIEKSVAEYHFLQCLKDVDMYQRIVLIDRDWKNNTDTPLREGVFD